MFNKLFFKPPHAPACFPLMEQGEGHDKWRCRKSLPFSLSGAALGLMLLLSSLSHATSQTYTLPNGEVLQDPTRPANWLMVQEASAQPAKQFRLNYILSSNERSQAMINGQRVGEGDRINGARVVRITAESVTLNVDGQQRVLKTQTRKTVKK